jgi:hypothetical protein
MAAASFKDSAELRDVLNALARRDPRLGTICMRFCLQLEPRTARSKLRSWFCIKVLMLLALKMSAKLAVIRSFIYYMILI